MTTRDDIIDMFIHVVRVTRGWHRVKLDSMAPIFDEAQCREHLNDLLLLLDALPRPNTRRAEDAKQRPA